VKALQKMIVMSATYRQSSKSNQKAEAVDPENLLLSHMACKQVNGRNASRQCTCSKRLDQFKNGRAQRVSLPARRLMEN
jgi:hypothetical protein